MVTYRLWIYGYGSIPINTIFNGMNIHLPAILMFTRGTRFWHTAISPKQKSCRRPQKDSTVTILESDFVVLSFGLVIFKVCCPAAVSPSSLGASTGHPRSISTFNASRLKQGDSTACVARGNSRKTQGLVHKSYSYLKYICIVYQLTPPTARGSASENTLQYLSLSM